MSASLEQSRQQLLHTAAERADHAGGEAVEQFLRTYYRHVATEDLLARAPEDLLGAAMAHRELAKDRPVGTAKVEVFNPEVEEQGWASGHTVVQIVTDDMPFLVDSVSAELQRMERSVHLVVHPTMRVRRNAAGELEELVLGERPAPTAVGRRRRRLRAGPRVVDAPGDRPRQRPVQARRASPRACAGCSATCASPSRTGPR